MTDRLLSESSIAAFPVVPSEAKRGETLVEGAARLGGLGAAGALATPAAIEIGERIRAARHACNLTQAALARKIGCKQADISTIERGQGRDGPSYRILRAIAEALRVELPINPFPAGRIVRCETRGDVQHATERFNKLRVVLSAFEWMGLAHYAKARSLPAGRSLNDLCTLLTFGPNARALRLRPENESVLVAMVRGTGKFSFRQTRHRQTHWGHGDPVAILEPGSSMDAISAEEGMSLMIVPASMLLTQSENGQTPA
jgi:transcriptional regulator with XRE-family HTH domain